MKKKKKKKKLFCFFKKFTLLNDPGIKLEEHNLKETMLENSKLLKLLFFL